MEKFVPYEKLSKKKKKELDSTRRGTWYGINPVTRKPENSRAYNRKKTRTWSDDSWAVSFFWGCAKKQGMRHFLAPFGDNRKRCVKLPARRKFFYE